MRHGLVAAALLVLTAGAVQAQDITIPLNIERLASKAAENVNVNVDGALLQLAGKFLGQDDPEQKAVKNLIANLKGIYVRSLEFAKPGEYSDADVDSLRKQLKAPAWTSMANVRSAKGGENVDVFLKMEKEKIVGLVVIAAEATRLTIVNIVGPIDLDQLASLGGHFGVPKVNVDSLKK
jgi:hypothetical protein